MDQPIPDDEFFIPDGYNLFRVKQTTLGSIKIPSRVLPYASDTATLKDLTQIFMAQYDIKLGQFGGGKVVHMGLEGVTKLPQNAQVFELKSRLNHLSIKTLEFLPFIIDQQAFSYECFAQQNFAQNPNYKSPEGEDNTIQICLELSQLNKVFYCDLAAGNPLEIELEKALKGLRQKIGKDLSTKRVRAICKGCGEQANLQKKVFNLFQDHFSIQLRFDQLEDRIPPKPLTKVDVELIQGGQHIKRIPFVKISRKKVKTVLEECRIPNAAKMGLRILGILLRPGDLFSRVESQLVVKQEGTVQAYIVEESEIFYSIGPRLMSSKFDLQEITAAFSSHSIRQTKTKILSDIYLRRQRRIAQISNQKASKPKHHRSQSFLDPIFGYTSQIFYRQLNQCLRDTNFGQVPEAQHDKVEYKFSYAIIRSLFMLPGYNGKAYRGIGFRLPAKVGEIICFKAFTSSSKDPEKAKLFGNTTYYTIYSLSGRDIEDYSFFKSEREILFMPYTYFQVISVENNPNQILITLQQIPSPRRSNSNLLMWVDDEPKEGSIICENLVLKYPGLTTQVIQITSNKLLEQWIKKFGHCVKERSKVTLITDLKRGEQRDAGLDTIRILKSLGNKNLSIFLYVFNLQAAMSLLSNNGVDLSSSLAIGNTRKQAMNWIATNAVNQEELTEDTCQLI